jgi:hypothetical protein
MVNKKFLLILLFILVGTLIFSLNIFIQKNPREFSPDYNQIHLFTELFLKTGTFSYETPLSSYSEYPIFGIRGLLNFEGKKLSTSVIPGIVIIYIVFTLLSKYSLILINPIFALLSLFYLFLIFRDFVFEGKTNPAAISVSLFAICGVFLHNSVLPLKDIPFLFFFLGYVLYAFKFIKEGSHNDLFLSSVLLGIAIWINYPAILFAVPLILGTVLQHRTKTSLLKKSIIFFIPLLIILLPLVLYQIEYTGGFLNFNSPTYRLIYAEPYNTPGILNFLLDVSLKDALSNFINHVLFVSPALIIICLAYFALISKKIKYNRYGIMLACIVALQFFLYLSKGWSGTELVGSAGTSYSRYLLFSWAMFFGVFGIIIDNKILTKRFVVLLIFFIITGGVFTGLYSSGAVVDYHKVSGWANDVKTKIEEQTPENSIFFAGFNDKNIYPVRQTAIYSTIPSEVRIKETVRVIKSLCDDGYPVYFTKENPLPGVDYSFEEYEKAFKAEGLNLEFQFNVIYKIKCPDKNEL